MVRAIARQAEAERERRAKIIHAEGELQASEKLLQAAQMLARQPQAMQLRYLQTLGNIAGDKSSTIVFPVPIDLLTAMGATKPARLSRRWSRGDRARRAALERRDAVARRRLAVAIACALAGAARAQDALAARDRNPAAGSAETFLDFRDDVADAAKDGRRLIVYFGQDGCPYCKKLMVTELLAAPRSSTRRASTSSRSRSTSGATRETTWLDGAHDEREGARAALDVQFTPTLLFFDEQGRTSRG